MNLVSVFESIGMSKNEARVYIAALRCGEAKVQTIAQHAKMARTTTYQLLEMLKVKGYMSQYKKQGIRYYMATNPRIILGELIEKKRLFEESLPDIDAIIWSAENKPHIRFFEGKQGVITVFEEMLEETRKDPHFRTISDMGVFELLSDYFPSFVKRRIERNIRQQTIVPDTKEGKIFYEGNKNNKNNQLRQVKLMPVKYELPSDETVCGNKVFSLPLKGELFALIIESEAIAHARKSWFEFMWDHLPG